VLPVQAYLPSVEQTVAIMLTGIALLNTCVQTEGGTGNVGLVLMDSAGIDQEASPAALTSFISTRRQEEVTYGGMWWFFNPDAAPEYGYERPPGVFAESRSSTAVTEPAQTSCAARVGSVMPDRSSSLLIGRILSPFGVSDLPDGGSPWHPNDSRYVAAEQKWSDCMATQGFDYATPYDAFVDNYAPKTPEATARGKAVATADVQCKIDTNLVGVGVAVQSAYDQQYIDSHRDALAAQQREITDFLAGRVAVPASAAPGPGMEQSPAPPS